MSILVNFKRHYLNGVHCGETFENVKFKMQSWEWACEWAHHMSVSLQTPEIIIELENHTTGDKLDLSMYHQRTVNEAPVKKVLRDMPANMFKLVEPTPQRRKDDGTEKEEK